MTPLKFEFEALQSAFIGLGLECAESRLGSQEMMVLPQLDLGVLIGGHGKVQFAVQSQYALNQNSKTELLICAGIAGALSSNLKIGDVIVAESTLEHDYKLRFVKRAPPQFKGSSRHIEKLRQKKLEGVLFGIVASGDEDVMDQVRSEELFQTTDALAVAWEGIGGAKSAAFRGIDYLELRAITDKACASAAEDFKLNTSHSMRQIGRVLSELFSN